MNPNRVQLQEEMRQAMAHLGLRYYGALDHVSRSNGLTVNELLFKLNSAEPVGAVEGEK